ncbi:MAG: hypothetical protein DRN19_00105 [Thermoplasmata archaeon]|nr:MAG: hypothetical protein DRN19_00105 [Thermoplasmata archaeon]
MKKYLLILSIMGILLISGCTINNAGKFEIHEWGVFLQEYGNTTTSSLTRSPEIVYVKKPVIYFHGVEESDVSVSIKNITIEKMIPAGNSSEDGLTWDVKVVDDEILVPNGTKYKHLFYEGIIKMDSPVIANVTYTYGTPDVNIRNLEKYTLADVIFVYADYGIYWTGDDDLIKILYFEKIEPETAVSIEEGKEIDNKTAINIIHGRCLAAGLDDAEINELIEHWNKYWFSPSNYGIHTRLISFIPQDVYDAILPITVSPEPGSIKRVGILTLVDIPVVNRPPLENLTVSVTLDRYNVSVNETVNISVSVTNIDDRLINLTFPTAKTGDFSIVDPDGTEVYRWSEGKYFIQVITTLTIKPKETITLLTDEWKPSIEGTYTIRAWLETTPRVLSDPAMINVTAD